MSSVSVLDQLGSAALPPSRLLVDGEWREASGPSLTHHHPATGEAVFDVPGATAADVDAAVTAARRAFDDGVWTNMAGRERAALLHRIADAVRDDLDNLNTLLSLDNATPSSFVGYYQMGAAYAADCFDVHAGWIDKITGDTYPSWEATQPFMYTTHAPIGVVGLITPWNAPLSLLCQKVAPALAAGCTVVVKPSELAPLTTLRLAELIDSVGLPPGVFNMVTGAGDIAGQALVDDPRVDKISFTGSRAVGGAIASTVGSRIGRVSLELGGKSPSLLFPDADLDGAVGVSAGNVFLGMSGQVCVCQSRMLIHDDVYDDVVDKLLGFTAFVSHGSPFDPGVMAAPMISPTHRERVMGHIQRAEEAGATIAAGGGTPEGAPEGGNFVEATVIVDADNSTAVAQEEIFGPVICAMRFTDDDDAVRIANDTRYGLAAAVYTNDIGRATRLSARLRAGNVGINTWTLMPHVPFGGVKESGLGRENGREGIMEYLELKTTFIG